MIRKAIGFAASVLAVLIIARIVWNYAAVTSATYGQWGPAALDGIADITYRWLVVAAIWISANIVKVPDMVIGFVTGNPR